MQPTPELYGVDLPSLEGRVRRKSGKIITTVLKIDRQVLAKQPGKVVTAKDQKTVEG